MFRRDFRLLLVGQFLGALGDNLVLAWLLGRLTALYQTGGIDASGLNLWNVGFSAALLAPYVALSWLAGWVGDRFARTHVLFGATLIKSSGILALAILPKTLPSALAAYGLVGLGACLYSPAKYGLLPELVPPHELVRANGFVETLTLVAILCGGLSGALLADHVGVFLSLFIMFAVYVAAAMTALVMKKTPHHPDTKLSGSLREFHATLTGFARSPRLSRILAGTAIFWTVGAVLKMTLQSWGLGPLGLTTNTGIALLGLALSVGVMIGGLLAGRISATGNLSRTRGFGALLAVALAALALANSPGVAALQLIAVGVAAGLFLIPLNAALQAEIELPQVGKAIAAQNLVENAAMLIGAGLVAAVGKYAATRGITFFPAALYPLAAVGVLAALPYLKPLTSQRDSESMTPSEFPASPGQSVRSHCRHVVSSIGRNLVRLALRVIYGFRVEAAAIDGATGNGPTAVSGTTALNAPGPVLLISNHVSWLDALMLWSVLESDWRFVISRVTAQRHPLLRPFMMGARSFPVDVGSPRALREMAEYLQQGGRLVLFAEGRLSRTGSLMKLFSGTGFLLQHTGAAVVTVYLRGVDRSAWAVNENRKRRFPRISLHVQGPNFPPSFTGSSADVRAQTTSWLRSRLVEQRFRVERDNGPRTLSDAIRSAARANPRAIAISDPVTGSMTARDLMIRSGVLARVLRREAPGRSDRVGVMLPNVNAAPVILQALWRDGRVPVILNPTAGESVLADCMRQADLRVVITSRSFLEKISLAPATLSSTGVRLIFVEDLRAAITWRDRLMGMVTRWNSLSPFRSIGKASPQDTAVVLFTSGSERHAKGVELTHANLLANIQQVLAVTDIEDQDRVFNALPLFHSFGLTIGLLLPLVRGIPVVLHPSPLDYRGVPAAFYDSDSTILMATDTFLRGYGATADPYDFRNLRHCFSGAEKLRRETAALWSEKFGVRILEGYGATECAPVIAVNTPFAPREGTVGRFLPGIAWRLDPTEGITDGDRRAGRLFVRGPNLMRGYLDAQAQADFQAHDGWYDTGDIASVDADGFVRLLGRQKRFAKIGGEMISLGAVEEALSAALSANRAGNAYGIATVRCPDPMRGERIVAVTDDQQFTMTHARNAVSAAGLSALHQPRSLVTVPELPRLGSGKMDYPSLERLVAAQPEAQAA